MLQSHHRRFHQKGDQSKANAVLLGFIGLRLAEHLELGDVGLIVLRHMRDVKPIAMQVCAGQFLDARQRLHLHRAELGVIDLRQCGQVEADAAYPARKPCKFRLDERLHVFAQDPALRTAGGDR